MIDFILSHPWSLCMAWILASFFVWSLCAITGQADEESEKMGRMDFTFWACVLSLLILAALWWGYR